MQLSVTETHLFYHSLKNLSFCLTFPMPLLSRIKNEIDKYKIPTSILKTFANNFFFNYPITASLSRVKLSVRLSWRWWFSEFQFAPAQAVNFKTKQYVVWWDHFARSNSYAKFVSFEFRNNRLSIKTKARQLHKQNIFRLRVAENFQTRSESEQKS